MKMKVFSVFSVPSVAKKELKKISVAKDYETCY